MINPKLHWLIREIRDGKHPKWTIGGIADAIYCNRTTVSDALNNNCKRGRQTRPKLVRFFKKEFPRWLEILDCLGWDDQGNIKPAGVNVPRGELHVEQMDGNAT